jgi:tRNA nucleotidyltransferase/poly(A) polymerase
VKSTLEVVVEGERCVGMLREVAAGSRRCEAIDLVGGWVRDRLLGLPSNASPDIDVRVATDDLPELVAALLERFGGDARITPDFPTARWQGSEAGLVVDLAAFRAEDYPRPGANPTVRPGSSAEDLARRDFTVNAIAYRIWPESECGLIDPHSGIADTEARCLRLLHPGSFAEDPTRVLRAARYAARLGFALDSSGRTALAELVSGAAISRTGSRLRSEWARLVAEPAAVPAIRGLLDWSAGALIGLPALRADDRSLLRLSECLAEDELADLASDPLRVLALLGGPASCDAVVDWFELPEEQGVRLGQLAEVMGRWAVRPVSCLRQLDDQVRGIPADCRAQLRLADPDQDRLLRRWQQEVSGLAPLITGSDLLAQGWEAGPKVGEVLAALRAAQLEGSLTSRAAALDKAAAWRADRGL